MFLLTIRIFSVFLITEEDIRRIRRDSPEPRELVLRRSEGRFSRELDLGSICRAI